MGLFEESWPFTKPGKAISNQKSAAQKNRINTLGLIARRRCLSQRQLSLATGLRASTIYNIVSELKELGLLREGGALSAERSGPKETELQIVPDCLWCAGVSLENAAYSITIANACAEPLLQKRYTADQPVAHLLERICEQIHTQAASLGLKADRLGGVCVSVPGVVNPDSGTVLNSYSLGLKSFALARPMQAKLNCPVWIERDTACAAYAEHNIGAATQMDSFIYFSLHTPPARSPIPGLAFVINEKIFRGCNSAAGEINRLLNTAPQQAAITAQTADAFYAVLATALAIVVSLLDIRNIILSSDETHLTPQRFARLQEAVNSELVAIANAPLVMQRSQIGTSGTAAGSALLAQHRALVARLQSPSL